MPDAVSRLASALLRLGLILALGSLMVTTAGFLIAPQLGGLAASAYGTAGEVSLDALSERSYVYAADGSLIATLQEEENRAPVALDDVPEHVIDAVLSVEDADFYNHTGVNARSTVRALLSNVESGGVSQGGSTITQQLVKQSLLTSEQDLDRKTREAFLAMRLEKQMPKDEILERYLNTIYLGNHSYGLQAAAETYFGVTVDELDVGQAALLAGMIRDPIDYNPFLYPDVAKERRRIGLRRLVEEGKITEEQAAEHNAAPIPTAPHQYTPPPDTYFVEEVKNQLLRDERLGSTRTERFDAVFRGGLRIHTTLDPVAQFVAEVTRNDVLAPFALEGEPALFEAGIDMAGQPAKGTVAIATVQPATGAVRAIVGGPGFGDEYKFNLATQGYRQPGSAFKTFVLLELLEQGYSPHDRASGRGPCKFDIPAVGQDDYEVNNFNNSRGSVATITSLTTSSSNCGYIRLGQIAGIDKVTQLAGRLGIRTRNAGNEIVPLDPSIFSTPLGTQEVTPLDMAAANAAIINGGYFNPPYFVEKVVDRRGDTLFEHADAGYRAVSIETAQIASDILKQNVQSGTGTRARIPGHDVGGKTGTAQDFSNAWFVGFTKHLSTAVWMGAIQGNVAMERVGGRSVTGGSYPAQIFGGYMSAMHQDLEPIPFEPAPSRSSSGKLLQLDRSVDLTGGSGGETRKSRTTRTRRPSRSSTSASPRRTPRTTVVAPSTDDGGDTTEDPAPTTAPPATSSPTTAPPATSAPPTSAPPTTSAPPPEDE